MKNWKKATKKFVKDLTNKEKKKLRKAFNKGKVDFENFFECPLGVLYGDAQYIRAIKHITRYSKYCHSSAELELKWCDNIKKAKKIFTKYLNKK